MSICQATKQRIDKTLTSSCERNEGHAGYHQVIVDSHNPNQQGNYLNIVWGEGMWGEKPISEKLWNECTLCGLLIEDTESECNTCTYWMAECRLRHLPSRLIMDGIIFNVEPSKNINRRETSEKTYTVIWYAAGRLDIVTDRITRYGKIPEHMAHLFGADTGRISPEKYPDGSLLVPYGRHVPKGEEDNFLEECRMKEDEYMSGICQVILDDVILGSTNTPCSREINHAGKHQAFKLNENSYPQTYKNFRWDEEDRASVYLTSPALWNECGRCGILILDKDVQCDDCNLEDCIHALIEEHGTDVIIVNGAIFIEEEKAKSNQKISMTVFWNDKNKRPLVSSYLQNVTGSMPKRYREALPDNATMVETSKTDIFPLAG